MQKIQAIQTSYNGYLFRSRLEARWAVFMDELQIKYVYEPEGLNINGVMYLPDFYLPESRTFLEVKGVLEELDVQKINALINAGHPVVVGYDNFEFQACNVWGEDENTHIQMMSLDEKSSSLLCKCKSCKKYWFMGNAGCYNCFCCGEWDGDSHYDVVKYGDSIRSWYSFVSNAINKAKGARFEFGDTPER